MMNSLIDQLVYYYNSRLQDDIMHNIACYIIDHINDIESIAAKKIVHDCYTSLTTVNKFSRLFGTGNFNMFKNLLIAHRVIKMKQVFNRYENTNFNQLYDVYVSSCHGQDAYDQDYLFSLANKIAELIHETNRVNFYGAIFPLSLIFNFQVDFITIGKPVFIYTPKDDYQGYLLNDDDLSIILSITGSYITLAKREFMDIYHSGTKKVFVSQKSDVVLEYINNFDEYFCLPNHCEKVESNYIILLLFDLVRYFYIKRYVIMEK